MRFLQGEEFTASLRDLYQKGGKFQKAAQTVQAIWGRAKLEGSTFEETFRGVASTNHGESRIQHCRKYDLTGFSRLVTVVNNGVCLFLFAGDHQSVDTWLDRNKGLEFVAKDLLGSLVLEKVRVSKPTQDDTGLIAGETDLSTGPLIDLLPQSHTEVALKGLSDTAAKKIWEIESITDDDELFSACLEAGSTEQQEMLIDVFLSLRSGDVANAKVRIDLFASRVTPVEVLAPSTVETIRSSESAVLLSDIDPELFQYFVETASFERWMLYLHPAQRQLVERNFKGPARVAGVSGSGKTCVVVHRALRLADLYQPEPVLLVTLSPALAKLINRLVEAQRGALKPSNLQITSIFDLCFDKLMQLEPARRDYYTKRSIAKNAHASSDHVDEVWNEFFNCENNNHDANVLCDLIHSLNARGIYSSDYLRQEFDYIRSSFPPGARENYFQMEREGRIVPFDERLRRQTLEGLNAWERKMDAVGVIDDMGIVAALYRHREKIHPQYRSVLVDEVQDLGTLELGIIRSLALEGDNDIFLCGDAAQTVYTKSADLRSAGIDCAGRSLRLNQNYRNSRQILSAANEVLTKALTSIPKGAIDLEVLAPEFASFSSPKPLLLRGHGVVDELERAHGFLTSYAEDRTPGQRYCIAVCGFGPTAMEQLGARMNLPILSGTTDITSSNIFISDLEQTKGYEFDAVVVVNCAAGVLPHPNLPSEESFRDLCRLYVAMTRAKTQLVISYSKKASPFIESACDFFVHADFSDYSNPISSGTWKLPPRSLPELLNLEAWGRDGAGFLRSRDAVGIDRAVQDEILKHVTGTERFRGRESKQLEWKTFGAFATAMNNPRARHQIISEEQWKHFDAHLTMLRSSHRADSSSDA